MPEWVGNLVLSTPPSSSCASQMTLTCCWPHTRITARMDKKWEQQINRRAVVCLRMLRCHLISARMCGHGERSEKRAPHEEENE